jgi:ATP/maltotriose-dependent transcriptional regulator MalT
LATERQGEGSSVVERTSRLVGRQDALARLRAAAELAEGAESRIVLIEGEAGIGKSRLVAELLSAVESQGALTLFGTCPPIAGPDLPLAPVVQALRGLARATSPEEAATVFGPSRTVLSAIVPSLAADSGAHPPTAVSLGLLFEHLLAVLERLSDRHKLVILVLDDIHWGGPSTWDLLAHLARNLASLRVLVLATYRRDALQAADRATQLLVELQRSPIVETVQLSGLTADDVAELMTDLEPGLSAAAAKTIASRAHGNPFYVQELVAAAGQGGVPETLRSTLVARIEAQPEEVVRVLRVAAVIGRRAEAELLIRVVGFQEELAIKALRHAVRVGLLEAVDGGSGDGYAFPHELLREVVYAELLPGERSRIHGAVARALSAAPDPDGSKADRAIELATHWRESGDVVRAVPALLKAADAAQRAYAFVEAHRLYEQAFASMTSSVPVPASPSIGFRPAAHDSGPEWGAIHAAAAEAASLAGEPARALEHIDAALTQGSVDGPTSLRWSERRARYLLEAGREGESLEAYQGLTERTDEMAPNERPRLFVAHARALTLAGHYKEAGEMAEAALGLAREAHQTSEESQALNLIGTSHAFAGRSDEGLKALNEARRLSQDRRTDSVIRPRPSRIGEMLGGQLSAARALEQAGRSAEALDIALEASATADRLGAARWRGELDLAAMWQLYRQGRWAEARARCDELLADAAAAPSPELHLLRARIGASEGRWVEADEDLAAAELFIARTSRSDLIARYHLALAELAFWRRRYAEGAAVIGDGLARLGETEDRLSRAELCLLALRLDVELRAEAQLRRAGTELAGHDEAATRALAEVRALLASPDVADSEPGVASSRGDGILASAAAEFSRLAGGDTAAWMTAVAAREGSEPYTTAYARWRLAEASLASREGRGQAADELRQAYREARELGAAPLAAEIEALATRARIDLEVAAVEEPPAAPRAGSDLGLSERELEVLALVAQGRTNRQIAEELFITEKTAGHHVSNILSKLGVANRLEAASIAHRAGLVEPRPTD